MNMDIKVDLKGITNLKGTSKEMHPAMKGSFSESMKKVFEESQYLVPVDTGALKESGRLITNVPDEEDEHKAAVAIEYGNELVTYAMIVHEDLQYQHTSPTQAKFLEVPFERQRHPLLAALRDRIDELFHEFR